MANWNAYFLKNPIQLVICQLALTLASILYVSGDLPMLQDRPTLPSMVEPLPSSPVLSHQPAGTAELNWRPRNPQDAIFQR